jgi:hypothetical protein
MALYAVHSPAADRDPTTVFDRAEFLKVGFSPGALVFGPFWLLAKRLWRALAVWVLGAAIIGFALAFRALDGEAALLLYALSAVFLGLEGRALQAETLARNGLPLVEIVGGADAEEAERAFLERARAPAPAYSAIVPRAGSPPHGGPHVIGFFPEAGR